MYIPRILRKSNSNGRIGAAKKKFYDQLVREIRAFGSGMDAAAERTLPAAEHIEHILAAKDVRSKGGPPAVYKFREGFNPSA